MTKFSVLVGSMAAIWLVGCDDAGVEGNGERRDELRETATFSRIRSDCELDVETVQGDQTQVVVSIDSNLQDLIKTRVIDDTLYIEAEDEVEDIIDGPHVFSTVPALTAVKLAGSGRMAFWLEQPDQPLDFYLSGSGGLLFEGSAAAVGAYLSGSGGIRLQGATSDLEVDLSGSGSVRAQDLQAESARIELSGSGHVAANVSESVRVSLSGSGDIDLYGGASLDVSTISGSGDVNQH